ncbi:MAG TPA: DUF1631 family protein [Burkholderiaceae bacterium]|nr:DUF1631 family protein [Burkholderiaceae bacterium]
MNAIDSRTQAALDAAFGHVASTAATAAERAAELLGTMATTATRIYQRDAYLAAQSDLRHRMPTFCRAFGEALRERLDRELDPTSEKNRRLAAASWETLSLVADDEVEERMLSDRISQAITHECEWELRDLAAYIAALLRLGSADQERNPFRPEAVGAAIFRAIEAVSTERETRKLLARELAPVMAKAMRLCYGEILSDLKARGVQPVNLSVRGVEGPGSDRVTSGYASLPRDDGSLSGVYGSHFDAGSGGASAGLSQGGGFESHRDALSSRGAGLGGSTAGGLRGGGTGSGRLGGFAESGRSVSGARTGAGASRLGGIGDSGHARAVADAELMSLIRRLTFMTSRPGALDAAPDGAERSFAGSQADTSGVDGAAPGSLRGSVSGVLGGATGPGALAGGTGGLRGDGLTGLMAVNLIRAHRDELRQASSGTLDHMVIDVVGSLFDQILSDTRVPPQMARQIARLQLPVLRVALADPSFFSSRKHPVRRFVNRIASLACAFEDFDSGAGQQFLARVRELVQEIIEGDFDQVEVYAAKLTLLEAFIEQQNERDVQSHGEAATLLEGKESELRVQQRYMHQLQTSLAPLIKQDYLRDFLAQVWSQALALAVRRDGPAAERTQRLRRAAIDLVMSVQPKGTPALRKAFLMQLPGLMKALHEGMALVGWPEPAQKEFLAKLLPAHAESLNGQPLSELDRNLLAKQLETAFNAALPRSDPLLSHEAKALSGAMPIEPQFSAEEAARLGLVKESAVDWDGKVDIDLGDDAADTAGDTGSVPIALDPAIDIDIDLDRLAPEPAEPAEPTRGPALMDHLRVGFAYQMNLQDGWKKVRLSYVSQGRSFFAFTHGRSHQETLSLTARMLARMCETGRIRAFESSYLLERATARARRQLAALKPAAGSATTH